MTDQQRGAALDLDIEAPPDTAGAFQAVEHHVIGIGRQSGVDMEKEQHVAGRLFSARVHLRPTPGRRGNDTVSAQPRTLDGRVAAAAVDHHHLGAERAQDRKRIEGCGDAFALVEDRHDDRELRHDDGLVRWI